MANSQEKLAGILRLDLAQLEKDVEKANSILMYIGKDSKITSDITTRISASVVKGVEEGIRAANAKGIELKVKMVGEDTGTNKGNDKSGVATEHLLGNQAVGNVMQTITTATTSYNGAGDALLVTLRGINDAGAQVRATLDDMGAVARYSITQTSETVQKAAQDLQALKASVSDVKAAYEQYLQIQSNPSSSASSIQAAIENVNNMVSRFRELSSGSETFIKLGVDAQQFQRVIEQGNGILDTYRAKLQQLEQRTANTERTQQERELQQLYRDQVRLIGEVASARVKVIGSSGEEKQAAQGILEARQAELQVAEQAVGEYLKAHAALQGSETAEKGMAAVGQANTQAAEKLALALGKAADNANRLKTQAEAVPPAIAPAEGLLGKLGNAFGNLGNTIQNSIVFTLTSMITRMVVQMPIQAIKEFWNNAWEYATQYYDKLNEIQIVTGQTEAQAMALGQSFRQMAAEMSVSSNEIIEAATIFYRQGLGDDEVATRMQATIQYAKTAGIEAETAANMITAVVNSIERDARGVEISAQRVSDVFLYLGDNAATSGEEIGRAMQRSAALADAAGVSFEMLGSYIATVSERTRQDAGTIGTALNAIMSRLTSVKQKGYNEEDETKVNDVAKALAAVNVRLTDGQGQWRRIEDIFQDVANIWDTLDSKTQNYLATIMAGTRQQNVFRTLMADLSNMANGTSRAMELYEGALDSAGTASTKYATYVESVTAAHDRMSASWERVYSLFNANIMKGVYQIGAGVGDTIYQMFGGSLTDNSNAAATNFMNEYVQELGSLLNKLEEYHTVMANAEADNEQYTAASRGVDTVMRQLQDRFPEVANQLGSLTSSYANTGEAIRIVNGHLREQYQLMGYIANIDLRGGLGEKIESYANAKTSQTEEDTFSSLFRDAFNTIGLSVGDLQGMQDPAGAVTQQFEDILYSVTSRIGNEAPRLADVTRDMMPVGLISDAILDVLFQSDGKINEQAFNYLQNFYDQFDSEGKLLSGFLNLMLRSSHEAKAQVTTLQNSIIDDLITMGQNIANVNFMPEDVRSSIGNRIREAVNEVFETNTFDLSTETGRSMFAAAAESAMQDAVATIQARLPELEAAREKITQAVSIEDTDFTDEGTKSAIMADIEAYLELSKEILGEENVPYQSAEEMYKAITHVGEAAGDAIDPLEAFWNRMEAGARAYQIAQESAGNWTRVTDQLKEGFDAAQGGDTSQLEAFFKSYAEGTAFAEDEMESIEKTLPWIQQLALAYKDGEISIEEAAEMAALFNEKMDELASKEKPVKDFWTETESKAEAYRVQLEAAAKWSRVTSELERDFAAAASGDTSGLEEFFKAFSEGTKYTDAERASIQSTLPWINQLALAYKDGSISIQEAASMAALFNREMDKLTGSGNKIQEFWSRMDAGVSKFNIKQNSGNNWKGLTDYLGGIMGFAANGNSKPMETFLQEYAKFNIYSQEEVSAIESDLTWLPVFFNYFKDGDYSIENVNAALEFFNKMLDEMNSKNVEDPLKAIKDSSKGAWASAQGDAIRESWRSGSPTGLNQYYDASAGTVQWTELLTQLQDYQGKGLSYEDMNLDGDAMSSAIDRYFQALEMDESDPLRAEEIAAATEAIIAALENTSDAWDRYHEAMVNDLDADRQAEILRDLADSSSIEEMRGKFNQLTKAEQEWVTKSSRAFREINTGTKTVAAGVKDLRREAAQIEFEELEDGSKVWDGMGDIIENAGKKGKEFSKTYGKMIDRVDEMANAQDALAYIQSGVTDDTDTLEQAYKDLASYTGVSADELRNNLEPALWALQSDSEIAGNTIANLFYWLADTAGVTFNSSNWQSELSTLAGSADQSTAAVAQLVQQMLSVAGATISVSADGQVHVNWPNGSPSGYTARQNSGGGRRSGGGGGGGGGKEKNSDSTKKTISEIQKMTDMMKQIQELFEFHQSMLQQIQSIYENKGELTNLIHVYEEEYNAIQENNKVLEENVKRLEALIPSQQRLVAGLATTDERYEEASKDLERLQSSHQEYTKQLLENVEALDELQNKMRDQKRAIRELEIDLENTILQAIEDRESRIQDLLDGRIAAEEMVMETIISLYERERDSILKTAEARQTALQNELDLLDETLNKRKEAADQADKEAELAELEEKLSRISADPTRRAEQLKLQEQIAELRDELAWKAAEDEVEAQKQSIDQQITSLEDYVAYVEEYYEELFEHPKKLIAEMEEILAMTDEEIMAWMMENNEEYLNSTNAVQTDTRNGWQETLDQMRGTLRLHWDEVHAIMAQGDDAIIEFLKENSEDYRQASKLQAEAYVDEWKDKLKELVAAYKDTYQQIQAYSYVPIRTSESSGRSSNSSKDSSGGGGGNGSNGGGGNTPPVKNNTSSNIVSSSGAFSHVTNVSSSHSSSPVRMYKYASGGLASHTGFAWLDGDVNQPERVLSPYQTELFEDLIQSLHSIRVSTPSTSYSSPDMSTNTEGNVVLEGDIVVNVESLSSDEDYEEMANRVMETIADGLSRGTVVGGLRYSK